VIEGGKTDGKIKFLVSECKRNLFFPVSGEKGSLLYASQREVGRGCGLVSSAQQGAFLSSLPRGGAPASALNTGGEEAPRGGARDATMERHLAVPGKWTCAGFIKRSGRTERCSYKNTFLSSVYCVDQRRRTL